MDPRQSMRAASWWISWREMEWPTIDNRDAIRRRADEFAASGVDLAVIFGAHFRWDFMPYWTMLHDYMAAVAEALHERNIRLFDHHSAIYVHRYDTVEEMRHIMQHNGSHLPVCPDRKSAASWMFNGQYLNDWRMIDINTNQPYWKSAYDAEVFCAGKKGFVESYCEYVKLLIKSSNIDGLMSDDTSFPKHYATCGCPECRERFRQKSGIELPPVGDKNFWGNWENPAWNTFIDDRFEVIADFYRQVRAALPSKDFPLTACCSSCCGNDSAGSAHDLRMQLAGGNIAHLELCGNTPCSPNDAWHGDFTGRLLNVAFNQGIAAEHNVPVLAIHYGFIPDNAAAGWALCKALGANSWFSTLPYRLGVSRRMLETLQGDAAPASRAFNFEKNHPELFCGKPFYKCSIFFSYETRNHSAYGSMVYGYCRDFSNTVLSLYAAGAMPDIVSIIPENGAGRLLIIPSAAMMTDAEKAALKNFLATGGKVIATGPCAYENISKDWSIPMQCAGDVTQAGEKWMECFGASIPAIPGERRWQEKFKNFFYHPGRLQDGDFSAEEFKNKVFAHSLAIPGVQEVKEEGFFATAAQLAEDRTLIFLTAANYDARIDEAFEAIRNHRSRVNLFTQAPPCDQSDVVEIVLDKGWKLENVTLPFEECKAEFASDGKIKLAKPAVSVIAEVVFKGE